MKSKSLFITLLLALMVSATTFAQGTGKIIAVVKTASWCSICKVHGDRAIEVINENNKDGAYKLVFNDVTSPETAKTSAAEIEKLGLTKSMEPYIATGVIYLFDATTKKPINQLLMALSSEDISKAMAYFKQGK